MKLILTTAIALLVVSGSIRTARAQGGEVIEQRKANQQARIKKGVASGQVTKKEAANLERRQTNLKNEINADRAANGGKLTKAQQRRVHNEQNAISRKIHEDKHNDETQPGVSPK